MSKQKHHFAVELVDSRELTIVTEKQPEVWLDLARVIGHFTYTTSLGLIWHIPYHAILIVKEVG